VAVSGRVVAGIFAYGNPASVGEPLGLFHGQAQLTGDVTGTQVSVSFELQNPSLTPTLSDQRREYVLFIDGVEMTSDADAGNWSVRGAMHLARSNVALAPVQMRRAGTVMVDNGSSVFIPDEVLWPAEWQRMPIFWDTQELAVGQQDFLTLQFENNVNNQVYDFACYGRYYDRQLLSNRSFGRLVSPPPVAPFG